MSAGLARAQRATEVRIGRYRVVAGWRGGRAQAAAFCGRRRIAAADGDTLEIAVAEIETRLEAHRVALVASRRDAGRPGAAEYGEALEDLPEALAEPALRLLRVHAALAGEPVTISDLARRARLDRDEAWTAYRRLGRRLFTELQWSQLKRDPAPRFVLEAFADCAPRPDGELDIRLKPEILEALA